MKRVGGVKGERDEMWRTGRKGKRREEGRGGGGNGDRRGGE